MWARGLPSRANRVRQALRPAALALAWLLGLNGCSPYALYTRPSGAVVAPGVYRVPPGWDYRQDWQVPSKRVAELAQAYRGTPYLYGGTTRRGIDCSGFVLVVYRDIAHAHMPRTTAHLKRLGLAVRRAEAHTGDLVFFRTSGPRVNHVGIYLDNGRFAHASSSLGVTVSGLDEPYYRERLAYIRRVF
jgi:hypothetical protein